MANFYKKSPSTGNVVWAVEKKNQLGRSMIEMLGVLAIIGVLSVAGIAAYGVASDKQKGNKTLEQMAQIIMNTRRLFDSESYKVLDNKLAIKLNIIPQEMVIDAENGVIKNLYGGDVIIEGTKDDFKVIFNKLPKDVSMRIGTQDWGVSDASLQQVKLN